MASTAGSSVVTPSLVGLMVFEEALTGSATTDGRSLDGFGISLAPVRRPEASLSEPDAS